MVRLVESLSDDPKSQFYLKNVKSVNKTHVRQSLKNSRYELDRVTYSLLPKRRDIRIGSNTANKVLLPAQNKFTRITDIQHSTTDKGQKFQADLADIQYLKPRAGESKFCLVIVDVYSQRVYLYGLYRKSNAREAFETFLSDTASIRKSDVYTLIQSDEGGEFFNKALERLLLDNRVKLYTTKMNKGHAFMAEQKIREVKKKLTKLKARDASQRIKKMLVLVEESMNNTNIGYLGISPMEIEREPASIGKDSVKKLYIGKKLTKHKERISRYVKKKDKNIKNLKPLQVGNLVWIASGRVQKKRYRGALDKPTSDKKPNYDTEKVYLINKRKEYEQDHFYYRLTDAETRDDISGRFYRDELYLL